MYPKSSPQQGTMDAEIKAPLAGNPELSQIASVKLGGGQDVA